MPRQRTKAAWSDSNQQNQVDNDQQTAINQSVNLFSLEELDHLIFL